MAEYLSNPVQTVALNQAAVFDASIPCNRGNVFHEDGTGNFILRGNTPNCFARYQVAFNGNIALPEGAAVTPIAVALTVNGEIRPTSRAIGTVWQRHLDGHHHCTEGLLFQSCAEKRPGIGRSDRDACSADQPAECKHYH